MAIDPNNTSTVRVGELPSAPFLGTDLVPHEVAGQLKKGTLSDLATFIGNYVQTTDSVGFRAVTVTDGQTLPSVTAGKNEFILVGKGTFYNVGGGATIVCTEELNALVTSGISWAIGVEINIEGEDIGIVQTIREGFLETAPSEDAVYKALQDFALSAHATTHEQGGTDEIQGQNLRVDVIPSVLHYSPVTNSLKGHLNGIDSKLGQLSTTTAGLLSRVFYTADTEIVNGITYLKTNFLGQGTTPSAIQTVSVDDNQTQYFAQQLISNAFATSVLGVRGSYIGQLTVMVNSNSALQEFGIEAYRCDGLGNLLPSGVTGAPIGSLGVTVIAITDSGQVQLDANQITSLQITGELLSNVTFNTGERIRYRVFARKIGTTGGAINASVYFGTNYNSYYDTPVQNTTDSVINRSGVDGITATDALNWIKANKQNTISGATNYLNKYGSGGVVQSQIFDNGTNVGFGLTNPIAKFHFEIPSSNGSGGADGTRFSNGLMGLNFGVEAINNYAWIQSALGGSGSKSLLINPFGGNLLVNKTTDDLTNKLQVNGTISALAGTQPNQVVVNSQLDGLGISSGSYTPVSSSLVNVTSPAINASTYTTLNGVVSVTVGLALNTTALNTNSSISITLPVNRTGGLKFIGSGVFYNADNPKKYLPVYVKTTTTNTATLEFASPASGNQTLEGVVSFQYQI